MPAQAPTPATPDRIRESLLSQPDRVDLESIALGFVKLAGGTGAMSKLLYDEYTVAPEGSAVRARIMETIMKAFTKLDAKIGAPDDLSVLTDDDLERLLVAQVSRVSGIADDGHPAAAAQQTKNVEEIIVGTTGEAGAADPDP